MALNSTCPGRRRRSPAIATRRPSRYTPRYRPNSGVRGPNGPGYYTGSAGSLKKLDIVTPS